MKKEMKTNTQKPTRRESLVVTGQQTLNDSQIYILKSRGLKRIEIYALKKIKRHTSKEEVFVF